MDYIPRQCDLIFVRGMSPFDHLVESISHSPYSHVAMVVKPNETFETQALRGAEYNGLDVYRGASDVFTCDSMTDDQRAQAAAEIVKHANERYGYRLLLWEGVHYLLHWDPPYDQTEAPDCSQLVLNCFRTIGIDLCPGLTVASPGDLAQSKFLRNIGPFI